MEILANDLVGLRSRMGDPTGHLFHVERFPIQCENIVYSAIRHWQKTEARGRVVPKLPFAPIEINGTATDSARRSGLESADLETDLPKGST